MNKNISPEQVVNIFNVCHKLGIETFAYFIIGYIHETEETMMRTIDFARKLKADWYMFTVATPLPCTVLFDLSVKKGLIAKDYWVRFVQSASTHKSVNKSAYRISLLAPHADYYVRKAYFKTCLQPLFIFRKIRKIKSFNDIMRMIKGAYAILTVSF